MANNGSPGGLGDVRNLLGFLVAGFVGALNLLGLKSAEVGVVLRNESFNVSIVAIFLLVGILAAMASIFVTSGGHPVPSLVALTILLLLASMFSLLIWIIPLPSGLNTAEHAASMWVTVALWVLSGFLLTWTYLHRKRLRHRWPDLLNLQSMLLVIAIMLTSTATYGVLRLETISQTTTVAEIGDSLQVDGHVDALAISISAAKLSTQEWLGVNVMAVPRVWHLDSMCSRKKVIAWKKNHHVAVTCTENPCYYFSYALGQQCTELSTDVIPPDSSGGIQRTIEVLFSPRMFQHVRITAVTCRPPPIGGGRSGSQVEPKGTCVEAGGSSRLDIAVP